MFYDNQFIQVQIISMHLYFLLERNLFHLSSSA